MEARWYRIGDPGTVIPCLMIATMLRFQMEPPVVVKVPIRTKNAQLEHGLGARKQPARPGLVHSIAHQIPACPSIMPVAIGSPSARARA
jgi:hypothetical protein